MSLNSASLPPGELGGERYAQNSTRVNERAATKGSSPTEKVIASCREDIARLTQIFHELHCAAVLRGIDGTAFSLSASGEPASASVLSRELSAPIYDAEGVPMAHIAVDPNNADLPASTETLLRAFIQSAARALSERWFRLCYCRQWIMAALRQDGSHTFILLALDRNQRLIGADRQGREFLEALGRNFEAHATLAALFRGDITALRGRRYCDTAVSLQSCDDGALWSVLITPPAVAGEQGREREQLLLHARPRLDVLRCGLVSAEQERRRGLPPRMLRRIEEYVDAHLEAPLNVDGLAVNLGMSTSNFARSFRHAVGLTPHGYVMRRRLSRAKELLANTDLALVEIALATGFADQSHFSRRFHQLVGLPPKAFRAQHR